jgi:hypothetical protein
LCDLVGERMGTGEFGADRGGVGVVEVVEDGQRLLPGDAGSLGIADGVVGVA